MRKLIVTLVSALTLAALPVASVSAHGYYRPGPIQVYGTVTNNGHLVSYARAVVSCDGHNEWDTTNRLGQYDVTFSEWKCVVGDTVTVTASRDNDSGMSGGKVAKCHSIRLNVAVISVALPEFGLLTGTTAAVIGSGIVLVIRQRKLGAVSK